MLCIEFFNLVSFLLINTTDLNRNWFLFKSAYVCRNYNRKYLLNKINLRKTKFHQKYRLRNRYFFSDAQLKG